MSEEEHDNASEIQGALAMAHMAHNSLSVLFYTCPPNYYCGGPAYAAHYSVDTILALMGVGVPMLRHESPHGDAVKAYQEELRSNAVSGDSILGTYMSHKSKIQAEAFKSILWDMRSGAMREDPHVTKKALLMLLDYYFKNADISPEKFWEDLVTGGHDELTRHQDEMTSAAKKAEEEDAQ